jgi:hypothetical protein
MTAVVDPQQLRQMQIVSGGMLGGAFLMLAVGYFFQVSRPEPGGLLVLSYMTCALAVLSPLEVAMVERVRKPTGNAFADHIVPYGILEGAALFCGVGLIAGANEWPLLAAAVPIGAMIVRFPRAA